MCPSADEHASIDGGAVPLAPRLRRAMKNDRAPGWGPWMLGAAERIARALDLTGEPRSAADLVWRAEKAMGADDFGNESFLAGLEMLTKSYAEEAALGWFGTFAARWDLLRFLTNLLTLRAFEKSAPDMTATIERPIFISGMPRSGTSFLHDLFALDPAVRIVRCWETIYPCSSMSPAARARRVDRQIAFFARLVPEIGSMHPISADMPQECSEITAHLFMSLRFDTTHHVPSYRRWLDQRGHLEAYQFHKKFLSCLQYQMGGGGRWVLKCPDHVFALEAIRAVYPDAGFIFLHRHPLEVLPSVARLTEVLRRPFTTRLDRAQIRRQVSEHWAEGADILVRSAETPLTAGPVVHLNFDSFVRDPPGTLRTLYELFGLTFGDDIALRLSHYLREQLSNGQRRNGAPWSWDDLPEASQRHRYGAYVERFGLRAQATARSSADHGPWLVSSHR